MSVHFATAGRLRLRGDQLHELVELHRQYALVLKVQHADAAATLDADPTALVTEILRLATLGMSAEGMLAAGVDGAVSEMVNDAEIFWDARLKP